MKKMTRIALISAVLVTSGLTAKVATENYKAVATNDERIHTAHENLKKPNKAAVLEAIVDAANAESEERIRDAVIIEPEEPKVVRIKTKVTTSAGVSPKVSVMDKKSVNKAEEFIENIAHPAEVVMTNILEFSPENIPVQELIYQIKDIFPAFGSPVEEIQPTYKIGLPEIPSLENGSEDWLDNYHLFDVNNETKLNGIRIWGGRVKIATFTINGSLFGETNYFQEWDLSKDNVITYDNSTPFKILNYSSLVEFKDSNNQISGEYTSDRIFKVPTYQEVYDFLVGVEKGEYGLLEEMIHA